MVKLVKQSFEILKVRKKPECIESECGFYVNANGDEYCDHVGCILEPKITYGMEVLKRIERAARNCYKSEDKITEDGESAIAICKMLVKRGHTAMLEHGGLLAVIIKSNRGLTHELVRHRLASYAQESTRYCNYSKDKHDKELTIILPLEFEKYAAMNLEVMLDYESLLNYPIGKQMYLVWLRHMNHCEQAYLKMIELNATPQIARGVLPIDVKSDIIISANPTEWRHILRLRTTTAAHPQIRAIMRGILKQFHKDMPVIFDDLYEQLIGDEAMEDGIIESVRSDTGNT